MTASTRGTKLRNPRWTALALLLCITATAVVALHGCRTQSVPEAVPGSQYKVWNDKHAVHFSIGSSGNCVDWFPRELGQVARGDWVIFDNRSGCVLKVAVASTDGTPVFEGNKDSFTVAIGSSDGHRIQMNATGGKVEFRAELVAPGLACTMCVDREHLGSPGMVIYP